MKLPSFNLNKLLLAFGLSMGFWGYIHFTSSLIGAVHRRRLSDLNPYHLINVDRFLGSVGRNGLAFAFGWLFFFLLAGVIYYLLTKDKR